MDLVFVLEKRKIILILRKDWVFNLFLLLYFTKSTSYIINFRIHSPIMSKFVDLIKYNRRNGLKFNLPIILEIYPKKRVNSTNGPKCLFASWCIRKSTSIFYIISKSYTCSLFWTNILKAKIHCLLSWVIALLPMCGV